MSDSYYLKIGGAEVIATQLLEGLSSQDAETKRKAAAALEECLKEVRVRVGTLLKTDNVSFLLGAGASMQAGGIGLASIPKELERALQEKAQGQDATWLTLFYQTCSALSGETLTSEARRQALTGHFANTQSISLNLEDYLGRLLTWLASLGTATELELTFAEAKLLVKRDSLSKLVSETTATLASLVDLPVAGKEDALNVHRRLIKKVLTRPLNLRRANAFTLNYDTLLEKGADAEGVVLVDGFVGTLRRVFRPESYDLDFYFPAQTTEGRVHRFDRALHLYKLHGSISWYRSAADWQNPYGLYATFYKQGAPNDDVLIYPSPLKYGQALGFPYSELFRRFGTAIAQPQSVLFVIGYGFGDEHVNSLIRQALAVPSFTLVVVDPEPNSDFVQHLKQLGDERVWLVSGKYLGTFQGFVDKLLPDLREEEIAAKVFRTFEALGPKAAQAQIPDTPQTPNGE
jgi:hypothetical protein